MCIKILGSRNSFNTYCIVLNSGQEKGRQEESNPQQGQELQQTLPKVRLK